MNRPLAIALAAMIILLAYMYSVEFKVAPPPPKAASVTTPQATPVPQVPYCAVNSHQRWFPCQGLDYDLHI